MMPLEGPMSRCVHVAAFVAACLACATCGARSSPSPPMTKGCPGGAIVPAGVPCVMPPPRPAVVADRHRAGRPVHAGVSELSATRMTRHVSDSDTALHGTLSPALGASVEERAYTTDAARVGSDNGTFR